MWGHLSGETGDPDLIFVDIETMDGGLVLNCKELTDDVGYAELLGMAVASVLLCRQEQGVDIPMTMAAIESQLDLLEQGPLSSLATARLRDIRSAIVSGDPEIVEW